MEGNGEKLNLSGRRVNGVSRYLMPKIENEAHLTNGNNQQRKHEAERNEENIELNLGLSTNGRFGVDPSAKKLKRSSSASSLDPDAGPAGNGGEAGPHGGARGTHAPLARASSLPADMEGLWRRRRRPDREMESARSMEARKKRMEKMKSGRGVVRKRGIYLSGVSGLHEGGNGGVDLRFPDNGGVGGGGSENWMMVQSSEGPVMGSQRGSGGIPVPHGQAMMGVDQNTMMRSSSSCQIPNEQVVAGPAPDNNNNKRAEKQKLLKNALLDMPHVSTGSNNHSRVEGILYRYRRADELRIVCVCHGLFLSPAEFVRHGGGGDVDQPLKHIVVNPFPLFQV